MKVTRAMKLMKQMQNAKSRRQCRLIEGKFKKQIAHLSEPLRRSAMNELERVRPIRIPY